MLEQHSARSLALHKNMAASSASASASASFAQLPPALASLYPPRSRRLRAIHHLKASVRASTSKTEVDALHIARLVEQHIFHVTLQQQADYNAKVLQVAWNLKLNGKLLLSLHAPEVLVFLDDQLLAQGTPVAEWWTGHEQRQQRQQQLLHEDAKFEEAEQMQSTHAALTCHRCHSRSIAVQQQQTRSADEGMTVYCTCKQCGLRWKM